MEIETNFSGAEGAGKASGRRNGLGGSEAQWARRHNGLGGVQYTPERHHCSYAGEAPLLIRRSGTIAHGPERHHCSYRALSRAERR